MPYINIYVSSYKYAYVYPSIYGNIYEQESVMIVKKEGRFFYPSRLFYLSSYVGKDDWFLAWVLFLWPEDEKLLSITTVIAGYEKSKSEKLTKVTDCDGVMAGFHRQSEITWRERAYPYRKLKDSSEALWSLVLQAITTTKLGQD